MGDLTTNVGARDADAALPDADETFADVDAGFPDADAPVGVAPFSTTASVVVPVVDVIVGEDETTSSSEARTFVAFADDRQSLLFDGSLS